MFDPARYDGRMPYRRCGDSGLLLPAISLGLWHNFGGVDDFAEGRRMRVARSETQLAAGAGLPERLGQGDRVAGAVLPRCQHETLRP